MMKNMYTINFTTKARKQQRKLEKRIQAKFMKQLLLLIDDFNHSSLYTKKMSGIKRFEARIDYHNRFTFSIKEHTIIILSVGMHDEGLGKK